MKELREELVKFLIDHDGKPDGYTWQDLAEKFNIRNQRLEHDGRKANDYWRWYLNYGAERGVLYPECFSSEPQPTKEAKVLIYDLETSRVDAKLWWSGKQYVGHKHIKSEPKIITVAWKWLGDDTVQYLTWDKNHSDKKLVEDFVKIYNQADAIVGVNNDNFDNRWLAARAAKHGVLMSPYVKSFDLQKKAKSVFRLVSYSLDYMTKFFGVSNKLQHEGIEMWDKVEMGTKEEQEEGLKAMVEYNIGDIISTEDLYLVIRKYMKGVTHLGTLTGKPKFTCPECGGDNIELIKTVTTAAGTIQRIMRCKDDDVTYKISNTEYIRFLDAQKESAYNYDES